MHGVARLLTVAMEEDPELGHVRPVSALGRGEGNKREAHPAAPLMGYAAAAFPQLKEVWQGQDSNLCRQCRRFYRSQRRLPAGPVPSPSDPEYRS